MQVTFKQTNRSKEVLDLFLSNIINHDWFLRFHNIPELCHNTPCSLTIQKLDILVSTLLRSLPNTVDFITLFQCVLFLPLFRSLAPASCSLFQPLYHYRAWLRWAQLL